MFQFNEEEYAKGDEFYDAFLEDPSDFMMRVYLPRVCGALRPLGNLPPMREMFSYYLGLPGMITAFGDPDVAGAFEQLGRAGAEARDWASFARERTLEMHALGFPTDAGAGTAAPFDAIGDFIRGTRGVMLDMFQRPEKLIAAMEKLVPICIAIGLRARKGANPFVTMPLHKGPEGFMSLEQYKRFYWPTLRKVMVGLIDEGLIPMPFFEGDYTSRLEVIKDIPRGKALYKFEKVDIHKAKEILGDTVCFRGNVPITLLCAGTPEQVTAYVKELIDVFGRDGGLWVDADAIFDKAKHENVKAMVEVTKEYGSTY
jgi:hypothetical protein